MCKYRSVDTKWTNRKGGGSGPSPICMSLGHCRTNKVNLILWASVPDVLQTYWSKLDVSLINVVLSAYLRSNNICLPSDIPVGMFTNPFCKVFYDTLDKRKFLNNFLQNLSQIFVTFLPVNN